MGFWKDLFNPFNMDGDVPEPWERQRAPYPVRQRQAPSNRPASKQDLEDAMIAVGYKWSLTALESALEEIPNKGFVDAAELRKRIEKKASLYREGLAKSKYPGI